MEGDFEPLTYRDRWTMMSTTFKLSCGLLIFTFVYFILVGLSSVFFDRCPAQPYLPWWMILIGVMLLVERAYTVPQFVKAFKEWQIERQRQQVDAELEAQIAENAANQGLIVDPAAAQLNNQQDGAVPMPVKARVVEENISLVARPFVLISIVASLFGSAFILEVFFDNPTGCSLFLLLPATMFCTVHLCLLCLFVIVFALKYRRTKIGHGPATQPPTGLAPGGHPFTNPNH